ncbi:SIR2 family protein [Enterobacter asburiae]|uniref:anti-phage defense-associated sirtuin Dsr1 n=1 Tax=Enterobacter asburiae TaxID=61645 RepID=UPI0025428FD3|nr:anti-phage defense-associated sirtuin Dsr1 [Enterobacter asburiae]ELQ7878660.1 SIR2 family protein [Enterobacter asburiae]ELQ7878986.1 SIR2 family protein [Enterobacter asburiae]ELR9541087.1 SIR2 family protein [Enterobacter asburiae]ELR9544930.1 SIR2 family protein [Enterobacter asburiae]WIK24578.1 SIR2 family protein [Enterobacter asburiae]
MQFITHGPDIPDELLQAHEEGRVVFFCGAGISYPADLPGFKGLVDQIYQLNGTTFSEIEREAYERGQFDATLDLLERRLPGQRMAVRRALVKALKPKLRRKGATDTQAALLRLARSREGAVRLVTTNFDRIFHMAAKRTGQAFQAYAAPMLPTPKNSRWDGLVYLHGLLPEKVDETALNRLVVTSGDFGLAYLTERWAARFVSELFRNYVVCFVGYSINDPVLRYMMDALAADRMLGEVTPQAWSLGDCEPGQEHLKAIEWEAKGVTPILYTVPAGTYDHSALHQTLHAWADTYRDGVQGKEAIVVKHALARPQDSTPQDDFVGRMLWALSDKSGLPAKRFADLNPVPPLDWLLEAFSDERFQYSDLPRFHVPPHAEVDTKLRFSLIRRPAPYDRAPQIMLVSGGVSFSQWDDVMSHIARWLVRYLDDPRLIIWIAERGGQMHDRWTWLIEHELDRFTALERYGKTSERDEILLHAPKAIPGPLMSTLWRLLLSGRVKSPWSNHELYRWQGRLKREGLTTTLRLELRELLAPKVVLKKPFRWNNDDSSSTDELSRLKQLVDWELVLAADHVHSTLRDLADESWKSALPHLLEDFQQLLRDALDLVRELGGADARSDHSYWDLPSITPHWQNRGFRDWVSLIEFLRDAWLVVRSNDSARATRIALSWFELPYPTFKRLALFAASQDDSIPPERWVNWLLEEGAWWLWSTNTGREVFRLFVLQGRNLAGIAQDRLEAAILAGPPREMYRDDLEAERWKDLVARSVWLHLAKLSTSGLVLGLSAAARLAEISTAYPQWQLATNERDEFSHWMSGTGDPDYEDSRDVDIAPRKRQELVQWLAKPMPESRPFYEDTWRDVCRTRFFHSLFALRELSQDGVWPLDRWREALQTWAEEGMVLRSWRYAAPLVQTMPDAVLQEIDHAVTWWMRVASKISHQHQEDILLNLCRRVLALETGAESRTIKNGIETYDPVGSAINHPIGHVTQALISLWFKQNPNDNDLLPADLKPIFTTLCDVRIDRFRHARVLLSSWLITFFRVDRPWTEQNLLPLFSWSNPIEAKAVWEGFLWSPRLYQPLLTAFKSQLLESANHYVDLGEHRQQFATFLTYAALGPIEGYTVEEFRSAIGALPQEGLEESAQALSQALEGTADQSEDYWKNRAQPFWQQIWPKSRGLATPRISESLTRMVIAARGEFPVALTAVQDWLQPIEHPHYVVHLLHESGMCSRYPADALGLLNAVIVDQQWGPQELGQCLDQIVQADAQLEQDARYQRLSEYSRRRGV